MTMKMKRMFAGIRAVDDNFHHVTLVQYKGVGIAAVDGDVVGKIASRQCAVQCWNLRPNIGLVIEESTKNVSRRVAYRIGEVEY